jgi:membrane fusion protein, heavy metal efflux system
MMCPTRLFLAIVLTSSLVAAGCTKTTSDTPKPGAPAKVTRPSDESAIATVTLTSEAQKRLGITLATVEKKRIARHRTFGGIVEIVPGSALFAWTPVAGTVEAAVQDDVPTPGRRVSAGQTVFIVKPLLSPERHVPTPAERAQIANVTATVEAARAVADGDVERAQAEVRNARIVLNRAEQLLKDRAGSERQRDDAKAALSIAQANFDAAKTRKRKLDDLSLEADVGDAKPLSIRAPQTGILRTISVAANGIVPSGAQLFEVVNLEKVWVRVPVYVGQIDDVRSDMEATVGSLAGSPRSNAAIPKGSAGALLRATPVQAPPAADPTTASADLIYEVSNEQGTLRPGERVGITVALQGEAESLVVPWPAVLHDIYGGTWIYEKIGEREYRRARVQVRYVADGNAVLATGPRAGAEVIVEGAAEVFGTEFGGGK